MASNQDRKLFQCDGCHKELDLKSMTLACLHSFCHSCLNEHLKVEENRNSKCPECHEHLTLDHLNLSPILAKSLRRTQLESDSWKCDSCLEDGIESAATDWCYDCKKLYCACCCRFHKRFQKEFSQRHHLEGLDGMERDNAIKIMTTDLCCLHQEQKVLFCEQCKECLCKTCFDNHSLDSPGCSSQPLDVREEVLKHKSEGPNLAKGMDDLETTLRGLVEKTRSFTDELNTDCDLKCKQIWQDYEGMMENAKRETDTMCNEIRRITREQVESWRHLLEESEKILKQLEICRQNLQHLVSESQEDIDVFYGLRSLRSKLFSWVEKSVEPEEIQLIVTFPNWWLQVLEHLKKDKIGSVSLTGQKLPDATNVDPMSGNINLEFDKEWKIDRLNMDILSICVSGNDNHVFLCDGQDGAIIEFDEDGKFVAECYLNKWTPIDCSISPNCLVVSSSGEYNELIFLQRSKIRPFLKIQKTVRISLSCDSLCQMNDIIFGCNFEYRCIFSLTQKGEVNMIRSEESSLADAKKMCADPTNGYIWVAKCREISCFNPCGEKILSKGFGASTDFCINEFGHIYFCTNSGIESFSPNKTMFTFEKTRKLTSYSRVTPYDPKIFVRKNRMFIFLRIHGQYLIKIFNIIG